MSDASVISEEAFADRHIGTASEADQAALLKAIGCHSMDAFIARVVPGSIFDGEPLDLGSAQSEVQALQDLRDIAEKNKVYRSLIGQGYYGTQTPAVIQRNILENPAWYTAYTPYQPEISQGRLEALLNFQTMVCDLTGMDIANASMLDEGTAAAEAMAFAKRSVKDKRNAFFVDRQCFKQSVEVVRTRASASGIDLVVGDAETEFKEDQCFAVLLQYPCANGEIKQFDASIEKARASGALVVFAADLLSLMLLKSPGELGADVVVGSTQRFGVPMGFGGPHAAYMATRTKYQRSLPGRLVGVSIDAHGKPAYRLALQTREQHIRREKATSNICTAQVLLAVMASMYACYHGPVGLRRIAGNIHRLTRIFAGGIEQLDFGLVSQIVFDTVTVKTGDQTGEILERALAAKINLNRKDSEHLSLSFDELSTRREVERLWEIFNPVEQPDFEKIAGQLDESIFNELLRSDPVLQHPVFSAHQTETGMLRYIRQLSDRDLALDRTMIPLGSCTMKLNATSEMMPVSWPEFAGIHPFVPADQAQGYRQMIEELENMLAACTGYDAVSLQPNAGSQGEFAGLLAIDAYHRSRGDTQRNICLIPQSAHGTNPASAQMCGMRVVVVDCDDDGNIDVDDLRDKAEKHASNLAAIMVTYPSTHGVFESRIRDVTDIVHQYGGQVYVDGANLNAMVGLTAPAGFGGDVSHLNLHKTFCIPHGGGGPGVGPVAAKEHLAPFLPALANEFNEHVDSPGNRPLISAAPFGSASILPISWMYIRMMGAEGLLDATRCAILNANYIAARLKDVFPVLYTGEQGLVAHECIIDLRPVKDAVGITVEDVAKRLIDYGFHAPTMSFPVAGTLMIEPTESESKAELDRFCDAMVQIKSEIDRVASGEWPLDDNPLVNAPHSVEVVTGDEWDHCYTRSEAVYPVESLRQNKYFSPVSRIDNVYGDRNLACSCPSVEDYREVAAT